MLLSHGSPSSHMCRDLIPGTRSFSTLALRDISELRRVSLSLPSGTECVGVVDACHGGATCTDRKFKRGEWRG
jgi:hypothetical protein